MDQLWFTCYVVVLALWTGGMALFTFIVTPAVFRSFGRDRAGEIVGALFPGYFRTNLVLSALAFLVFFPACSDHGTSFVAISVSLLLTALALNCAHTFLLHPRIVRVKKAIVSFETTPAGSDERARFRRLHAASAMMNLSVLACGMALLVLGLLMRR